MIITVTLNPAVDETIYVETLVPYGVNPVSKSRLDPGGKGINVSKMIHQLGERTLALGFCGGENGRYIQHALAEIGIPEALTVTEASTRKNTKIVEIKTGKTTDMNVQGAPVGKDALTRFMKTYQTYVCEAAVVVLSGSIPQGLEPNIYRELCEIARAANCKVVLDASGEALREGIKGEPLLVKPNIHELEELVGQKLHTEEAIIEAARNLLTEQLKHMIVSLGEHGALWITRENVIRQAVPKVIVKSTVGAGDSMVAGIAVGLASGLLDKEGFRLGVASSVAAITVEGTAIPKKEVVEKFLMQLL
ncbi:MAG: 1-phosphofructokinase [Clostridia bacterium]|nr:1-phosphofructokinase [Clostridia bacterium]